MRKSKNPEVQKWLDELKKFDAEKYTLVEKARDVVFKQYATVSERIMYGGIMFTQEKDFGGLFVSKKHVSFEFSEGHRLQDPNNILEGGGKYRRHLNLREVADIENKDVSFFVKQAA